MKEQLTSSVKAAYVNNGIEDFELVIIGEVFYMRRTRILKRFVRKVIHRVEVPIDHFTILEEAKAEARRQMNEFVKAYYTTA